MTVCTPIHNNITCFVRLIKARLRGVWPVLSTKVIGSHRIFWFHNLKKNYLLQLVSKTTNCKVLCPRTWIALRSKMTRWASRRGTLHTVRHCSRCRQFLTIIERFVSPWHDLLCAYCPSTLHAFTRHNRQLIEFVTRLNVGGGMGGGEVANTFFQILPHSSIIAEAIMLKRFPPSSTISLWKTKLNVIIPVCFSGLVHENSAEFLLLTDQNDQLSFVLLQNYILRMEGEE